MKTMAEIQYIKELYENQELSLREIAKRTKCSFKTVQKYAYMDDWNEEKLPNVEPQSYPILGKYIPMIDEWLEDDTKKPRKQRHTIKRIYDRLQEEHGYSGSYSSVKRYVRRKKYVMHQNADGYLPLAQPKGHAQADFGAFMYYDADGNEETAYSLTVTFPYSNKGYIQVFPSQNQECLLIGLRRIFEHIGGVPARIKIDNMSTAVARILEGHERLLTDGFRRFMLHYRFQADFCNPASGNEKGNVENKVGYGRRNAFVPVPTIIDFDEFNEKMWEWCEKDAEREHYLRKVSIQSLWEEEKSTLLPLPEYPYQVYRYETLRVNKNGFVCIDTNRYGLPPELHGELVQAKIFYDRIEFYHDKALVGEYERSYGTNREIMDWTRYVRTLCHKPGAVEHTRFFKYIPQRWRTYLENTQGRERKNALNLLEEIVHDGNAEMCDEALELAAENGRTDADSIRQCYYLIVKKEYRPEPMRLSVAAPTLQYDPDLSRYDKLTGGEIYAG